MTIDLMGATVYYEQKGKGKPCLLLHGWGGCVESWLPVLRDFANELQMTAIDFPGHGRSSEPPEAWSVTEYMELTAQLMRKLHLEGADIVAHSFGGRVALLLSATYPELVGRLVLTGCAGLPPRKDGTISLRTRLYKGLRALSDNAFTRSILGEETVFKARNALQETFGSADYRALTPTMRPTFVRVVNQDLTQCLGKIRSSTLLIWGRDDTATPLWMGETMEREIPDAGLVVLEGCGHFAYLDRYSDFQAILRNFLIG